MIGLGLVLKPPTWAEFLLFLFPLVPERVNVLIRLSQVSSYSLHDVEQRSA